MDGYARFAGHWQERMLPMMGTHFPKETVTLRFSCAEPLAEKNPATEATMQKRLFREAPGVLFPA